MPWKTSQTRWTSGVLSGLIGAPVQYVLPASSSGVVVTNVMARCITTGTAGSRRLVIRVLHGATQVGEMPSGGVQVASLTRYYTNANGGTSGVVATNFWQFRDFVLLPGVTASFRIADDAAVDANDALIVVAHGFNI